MNVATASIDASAPPPLRAFWLAARPATLWAAVVPVLVGSALARAHGSFRLGAAVAALVGAMLIQIGTNLFNDYADFGKGADTGARLGPPRATQQGWLRPQTVLAAALACFGAAAIVGLYLVAVAGWPLVVLGLCSIAAGLAYTGGPWPLAYVGLGEPFVFVFFGLVAVAGTYFVQALAINESAFWGGSAVGFLVTAILVVNNLRDRATDALAHKRTLAVRLGEGFTRWEYVALIGAAYAVPVLGVGLGALPWGWLLPLISLPFAAVTTRAVLREQGRALNPQLGATARLELIYGALLALGMQL